MKTAIKYLRAPAVLVLILISMPFSSYGEIQEETTISMSLQNAIRIAIINNKPIQIQEEEIDYAKANIMDAKSRFLPQIATGFTYTRYDAVFTIPNSGKGRKDPGIFSGYKNDNLLKVSGEETIYNGGADIANLKQARLGLKVQEETLRAARLDVEFETKRLFYGLLLAYETRRIAQDLVDQAIAHYEEVRMKYDHGTASKFDVLQSKTQVSRLMPQLVNADNAIDLIIVEFKKLLSLNMRDNIKIEGELDFKEIDITEEKFLEEAYRRQPQMILKLLGIDINKWGIEYAKAGWLPQVSAAANYYFRSNSIGDMVNPRHDNWDIGVKTSIAIFDGFSTKAKVDEAKARYNQAVLKKEDVTDQLVVDVKSACLDLRQAKAIIDSQKDSIVEAKEALRLSEVRFDNGVGINLDVLDAQVALAQVRQNLAQGIYDYTMAKAQLDKVMGREFSFAKEADNGRDHRSDSQRTNKEKKS